MHVSVDSTLVIFYSCGVMLQLEEFSLPFGMVEGFIEHASDKSRKVGPHTSHTRDNYPC